MKFLSRIAVYGQANYPKVVSKVIRSQTAKNAPSLLPYRPRNLRLLMQRWGWVFRWKKFRRWNELVVCVRRILPQAFSARSRWRRKAQPTPMGEAGSRGRVHKRNFHRCHLFY